MGLTEDTKQVISGEEQDTEVVEVLEGQGLIDAIYYDLGAAHIVGSDLSNTMPSGEDNFIIVVDESNRAQASSFDIKVSDDGLFSITLNEGFKNYGGSLDEDTIDRALLSGGSREEFIWCIAELYDNSCPDLAKECGLDTIIGGYMNDGSGPVAEPKGMVVGE